MRRVLVPTDLPAAGWLVTGEAASWGERKFSAWLPYAGQRTLPHARSGRGHG